MPLKLDYLPAVIKDLEEHSESLRLKKLVFCLSKGTWENNPEVLNAFTLRLLFQEIFLAKPTLPECIFNLYQIVNSINRREIYVELAKYLLEKIRLLYHEADESLEISRNEKHYIIKGIDVRELNFDDLLLEENESNLENNEHNGICINVMEIVVNEEIFNELKKIPLNIAKYMKPAEIAAYALNRLPPLYASSEEGKLYQNQKIEKFKDVVHAAVMQGIGAVMRDPIRKSTPLNVSNQNIHTEAYHVLMKLEKIANKQNSPENRKTFDDLAQSVLQVIDNYELAFVELTNFLRWYGLSEESISVDNLVAVIRKIIRKQMRSNINKLEEQQKEIASRTESQTLGYQRQNKNTNQNIQVAKETQMIDFCNIPDLPDSDSADIVEEESEDMQTIFSKNVRDWYTF